ncbi:hypothetical protein MTR67_023368 [Solanum verrucosum]|uniref:Tf2-1-like SH3-like domain-containing protein n=1 Tax=Solanum verrucosum TaxID=315347 RepID=A0AAF0QVC1_SOLVR|nr:hypothetical protein MTR67_023368 [Solanum verrucosum]
MKGVIRFGKKGKLSPRYVASYPVSRHVGKVSYKLELPNDLASVHPVFHVAFLKKCVGDPISIVPLESLYIKENLYYEEVPVDILDKQVRKLINEEIAYVKVLWRNQLVEGATWEVEADMISRYPHLFPYVPTLARGAILMDSSLDWLFDVPSMNDKTNKDYPCLLMIRQVKTNDFSVGFMLSTE